jgi:hypothetical protein
MKDVFIMAVYLGAKTGRPRKLDGGRHDAIRGGAFSHEEQMLLRGIAVGHTGNIEVIADARQVVRIAEQYANAGIWKLEEILSRSPEGALWDLADFFLDDLAEQAEPGAQLSFES